MQFIIMADGKGTRWNNYKNTTKQTIDIGGGNLLEHIIEILHEFNEYDIKISSHDCRNSVDDIQRIKSKYQDGLERKFDFDYLNEETVFLYGDTYYSYDCMKQIIQIPALDVMFYGNDYAIVGVKVKDYEFFKYVISTFHQNNKSTYHAFDDITYNGTIISRFTNVGETFQNINTPEDYKKLVENKKLILKRRNINERKNS